MNCVRHAQRTYPEVKLCPQCVSEAHQERQAEIERLRAALKDIAGDDYLPDGIRAIEIARRALERKP